MLNKDQYNQKEYNDYYRQEIEDAEIKSAYKKEGNNKVIISLGVLLLGVAGYFGFNKFQHTDTILTPDTNRSITTLKTTPSKEKSINNNISEKKDTTLPAPIDKIVKKEIPSNEITNQDSIKVNEKVTTVIEESTSAQKMSPKEIANLVKLVMQQMGQQNSNTSKENVQNEPEANRDIKEEVNDVALIDALSNSNVDSIVEDKKTDYNTLHVDKNIKVQESQKTVDTYNKVTIQQGLGNDELSKLSEQISNLINETSTPFISSESPSSSTTNYKESITKEIVTRSNAMRIIIVKKGDTLGKIAKRAYGNAMDYKRIYQANPDLINRPDRIYVGQKLHIPK